MRTASSSYDGMISTVSPRTRNVPRVNARSLRVYWTSTSSRSSASRGTSMPDLQLDRPVEVGLRRAQAVDARHRRHHDDVAPGQQARRGRVPQPLDIVVDRAVLLDVGVGLRDVRLGLVVVVVRHEVLDGVVRQHLPQLVGQLGGQRLVRRHHQRGPLHAFDQPGGGGRLAGAGGAEQHHVAFPGLDPALQLVDGGRLVAGRLVLADHLETPAGAHHLVDGAILRVRQHGTFGRESHVHQPRTSHRQTLFPLFAPMLTPIHPPKRETFDLVARHQHRPEGHRARGRRVHPEAVGALHGPAHTRSRAVPLPGVLAAACRWGCASTSSTSTPATNATRTTTSTSARSLPATGRWRTEDHYLDLVVRTGVGTELLDVDELLDAHRHGLLVVGDRRNGPSSARSTRSTAWPGTATTLTAWLAGHGMHADLALGRNLGSHETRSHPCRAGFSLPGD